MTEEQFIKAGIIKENINMFECYKSKIEKLYACIKRGDDLDKEELQDVLSKCNNLLTHCIEKEKQSFEKL